MYKVKFAEPVKNIDDLYSMVKDAYIHGNIPTPYPAANKQLQSRLTKFVSKCISDDQSMSFFDKVNSKRVYVLEKHDNLIQLLMLIKENDEKKKLIVLPVREEIQLVVSSFIEIFKQSGYIESAPKCHKRLNDVYCISNKRIRLIQRTIAKFILPDSSNDENTNDDNPNDKEDNVNEDMKDDIDDGDDDGQSTNLVKMSHAHKQSSLPPSSHHSIITTRSKSKLIEKQNVFKHI
ncbi:unnamed protein product [Rotaria magnacalcarata]